MPASTFAANSVKIGKVTPPPIRCLFIIVFAKLKSLLYLNGPNALPPKAKATPEPVSKPAVCV